MHNFFSTYKERYSIFFIHSCSRLYTCTWNTGLKSLNWKISGPFRPCKCDCVRDSKVSIVLGCIDGCGDGGDCFNCLARGPQISQVRQFYLHIQRELRSNATWRKGLNLQTHLLTKQYHSLIEFFSSDFLACEINIQLRPPGILRIFKLWGPPNVAINFQ